MNSNPCLIQMKDGYKIFPNGNTNLVVLKNVNLNIYPGEFLCITGESGSGKSTILNLLGGLDKLTSGKILFNGKDISSYKEKELTFYRRYNIGYVFQDYHLMPNLNVNDNLQLMAELVEHPLDIKEIIEMVGLTDKLDKYPSELSGGEKQRVAIARALIKNPSVILADEPTAALDYDTSIEVLKIFEQIVQKGTTLVMVTHNLEITKMANRIIKIHNGSLKEPVVNDHPLTADSLVW